MMFENFDVYRTNDTSHPFIVSCKDREVKNEERWVLCALSNDEAKQVYEYLGKFFSKN